MLRNTLKYNIQYTNPWCQRQLRHFTLRSGDTSDTRPDTDDHKIQIRGNWSWCKTCKLSSARNSVNSQISEILSDHKWFYSNNFSSLNQHLRRTSLELINGTDLDVANKGTVCSVGRGRENCFKLFLEACSPEKEINYFIQYDVKNTLKLFSYHNYSSEMGKYLFFKWW